MTLLQILDYILQVIMKQVIEATIGMRLGFCVNLRHIWNIQRRIADAFQNDIKY